MNLSLMTVGFRPSGPAAQLFELYLSRSQRYLPCSHQPAASEARLLADLDKLSARTRPFLILADPTGQQLSSAEFSAAIGRQRDAGTQLLVLAVGPPNGWSPAALARANLTFAFGRITLPHELAAVVAAEQLYRALTILAGHPYHLGH